MAFSTKIQGVPRDHGRPIWSMDNVNWWDDRALIKDSRFRLMPHRGGHLDYVAVLSGDEARDLAETFRPAGLQRNSESLRRLDRHLMGEPPECRWVLVNVYEWESGL